MKLLYLASLTLLLLIPGEAFAGEKIVDGFPARDERRAVIGSLYANHLPPANEGHFCAATLVRARWALTAGHCLEDIGKNNTDIVFARDDLRFQGGIRRGVVRKYLYPGYRKKQSSYDVGLLYLSAPIKKLRIPPLRYQRPQPGERLKIFGWGQTSFTSDTSHLMQEAFVRAKSRKRCLQIYSYIDPLEAFCAGAKRSDVCFGDSGGGVLNRQGEITGIISRGARCGDPDYPGVYSRLHFAKDWLLKTIANPPEGPFRSPRVEKSYYPFWEEPHSVIETSASPGLWYFYFDIYSSEKIRRATVLFPEDEFFCSFQGGCEGRLWQMEDLQDPYNLTFSLSGLVKSRCSSFSWRVVFQDRRIPKREGKKRVCAGFG